MPFSPRNTGPFRLILLLALSLLLLSACGKSKPTRYFAFSNTPIDLVQDSLPKNTLRVARVAIPQYLEREAIVQRSQGRVELHVDSLHVWAEPLGDGVRRLIHHTLVRPLLERGISVLPLASEESGKMTLLVDIAELDGAVGQSASLSAQWSLLESTENRVLASGIFSSSQAVAGHKFMDLITAEENLVRQLATHILDRIVTEKKRR